MHSLSGIDPLSLVGTWTTLATGTALMAFGATARCTQDRAAWDLVNERTHAWQAHYEEREAQRPVLWGTAEPGMAGTEYGRAAEQLEDVGIGPRAARAAALAGTETERSARSKQLETAQVALDLLRRGAHTTRGRGELTFEDGFNAIYPKPQLLQALGDLVVARFQAAWDEGERESAVEWLLDGMQMGADLMHMEPYITEATGCAVLVHCMEIISEQAPWTEWQRRELESVSNALEQLDRRIELAPNSLHAEAVLFVHSMDSDAIRKLKPSWLREYVQALRGDHRMLSEWVSFVEKLGEQAESGWEDPTAAIDVLDNTAANHPSPYVQAYARGFASIFRTRLDCVNRLRELRRTLELRLERQADAHQTGLHRSDR